MKLLRISVLIMSLLALSIGAAVAVAADRHVSATLSEVNGSGVSGRVMLTALPRGGTLVSVHVTGLQAGTAYVSLYYENHTCELEADSENDVVQRFTPRGDRAVFTQRIDDDLDEIHSISIRLADGLALQACADVNP